MSVNSNRYESFARHRAIPVWASAIAATAILLAAADAANAQAASLVNGQTVQGNLGDANDAVLPDGRPVDRYVITAQVPNQAYAIEASSPQIPVVSTISFLDPAQGAAGLQRANVFSAGQKLLFAGALPQPGRYLVNIYATDPQQPVGSYSLSLCRDNDDSDDDDDLDDLDDCLDDNVLDDDDRIGSGGGGPGSGSDDDRDDDGFGN